MAVARGKAGGANKAEAGAGGVTIGAAGGDVAAELAGLRRSVDQLAQALEQMLDTQATQTEMLGTILEATTVPTEPETKLADLLATIVAKLDDQTEQFVLQGRFLVRLPEDIGTVIAEQLASALAGVR